MRLTAIKLAGFKSFVDATTFRAPTNLTGVVGPNGCGKSNIIDAVRWVMGEGSARVLRGELMSDVIFSGSAGRKPVGTATVELVFDNSDSQVGGEFASFGEISVKRQVGRDGISLYSLNGTRCRRKDVRDLFLGTGLGSKSYSIIEQGMITQVVDARPEEIRATSRRRPAFPSTRNAGARPKTAFGTPGTTSSGCPTCARKSAAISRGSSARRGRRSVTAS